MAEEIKIDDGGPAFAMPPTEYHEGQGGMTLRQYYAGLAMQGMLSFPGTLNSNQTKTPANTANLAVSFADALIAELKKGTG